MARMFGMGKAPYISLAEAIEIIAQINRKHGERISKSYLADITGNTLKSSSFIKKLASLRHYGLAVETSGDVRLTDTGLAIVAPTSPNEEPRARVEAFLSLPLFRRLHDQLKGGLLPKRESLINSLQREHGIKPKYTSDWAERFEEALETAGLLSKKGTEWMILDSVSEQPLSEPVPRPETVIASEAAEKRVKGWSFSHPAGKVELSDDATAEDVKMLIDILKIVYSGKGGKEEIE